MKRIIILILSFFLLFSQVLITLADDIPTGKFKGDYYSGKNFDTFVFTREDQNISFNWWLGSPGKGVPADNFSVRWQGRFDFTAGDWEFRLMPDDGLRLFIDGEKIIDSWQLQHGHYFKVVKNLSAGTHLIVVEYYEAREWAGITLQWVKLTPAATQPTGSVKTTPGVVKPTTSPLYKSLYESSCEELVANPLTGDAPLEVDFSGAGYDPYGSLKSYIFNFGDKTPIVTQEDSYISHIFQNPGNYNVTLSIKDSKGNTRTADKCKLVITVGGYYQEGIGGYAEPTVYPSTASTLPKTGIFDNALWLIFITVPLAIFGLLLNRKFSKL
jgi:hypothetical protein